MFFSCKHRTVTAVLFLIGIAQSSAIFAMKSSSLPIPVTLSSSPTMPPMLSSSLPMQRQGTKKKEIVSVKKNAQVAGTQRGQHFIKMLEALAKGQQDVFNEEYNAAQTVDCKYRDYLKKRLASSDEERRKRNFEKLQKFAQATLDVLDDETALLDIIEIYVTLPKEKLIRDYNIEKLKAFSHLGDRQMQKEADKIAVTAYSLHAVRRLEKLEQSLRLCSDEIRKDLDAIVDSKDYAHYVRTQTGALTLDRLCIETSEINKDFEHPVFKKTKAEIEESKYYKKGISISKKLIEELNKYAAATEAYDKAMLEKIESAIKMQVRQNLEHALHFFKGLEKGLTETCFPVQVVNGQPIDPANSAAMRPGIAFGVFKLWQEFAQKIIHAQTKDQMTFCIAHNLIRLSIL